ncbi:MAG: acetyl-CoA synthase subunit gamma [Kiritimatiellaeota bacterium]|nr:acetyl-CoA synthase subunit gamma [Kiritimatiellota bacterium]
MAQPSCSDQRDRPEKGRCCPGPAGGPECGCESHATVSGSAAAGHWIVGQVDTPAGTIPKVEARLRFQDRLGAWKARWAIGRMNYAVVPGLYAVGEPGPDSPVFVTANYKMSFDVLRKQLADMSAWVLVLDTRGINVWCAAGKGTFGTDELVKRIATTKLAKIVSHRTLIVPQLGAPGVAAHQVKKRSGFRVIYGPVRASDIPRFVENGFDATPDMREVRFDFRDRLVLTPLEIVSWGRRALWGRQGLIIMLTLVVVSGLDRQGWLLHKALRLGPWALAMYAIAFLCGTFLAPLLLPWLPGRAFAVKGAVLGGVAALAVTWFRWDASAGWGTRVNIAAWAVLLPTVSSFIAVTFVGASTYTSLSGVFKEMRLAVPVHITATIVGVVLLVLGQFV